MSCPAFVAQGFGYKIVSFLFVGLTSARFDLAHTPTFKDLALMTLFYVCRLA